MRALAAFRDPFAILLAAAAAATLLALQEGPLVAAIAAFSVLAFRVAAGPVVERWRPATAAPVATPSPAPPTPAAHRTPETHEWYRPLTARQAEVALCLAEGLANKEIAARLHIDLDTVETHVFNIMNKLTLHNRTQIGVWIIEQRALAARTTKPAP